MLLFSHTAAQFSFVRLLKFWFFFFLIWFLNLQIVAPYWFAYRRIGHFLSNRWRCVCEWGGVKFIAFKMFRNLKIVERLGFQSWRCWVHTHVSIIGHRSRFISYSINFIKVVDLLSIFKSECLVLIKNKIFEQNPNISWLKLIDPCISMH